MYCNSNVHRRGTMSRTTRTRLSVSSRIGMLFAHRSSVRCWSFLVSHSKAPLNHRSHREPRRPNHQAIALPLQPLRVRSYHHDFKPPTTFHVSHHPPPLPAPAHHVLARTFNSQLVSAAANGPHLHRHNLPKSAALYQAPSKRQQARGAMSKPFWRCESHCPTLTSAVALSVHHTHHYLRVAMAKSSNPTNSRFDMQYYGPVEYAAARKP
jgi:hypothetical protein